MAASRTDTVSSGTQSATAAHTPAAAAAILSSASSLSRSLSLW
jgi:hypothetical protein